MSNETVKRIEEKKVELDGLSKMIAGLSIIEITTIRRFGGLLKDKHMNVRTKSSQVGLAEIKSVEGNMWLGVLLKELGTDNPYPNSEKYDNTTIEASKYVSTDGIPLEYEEMNYVRRVKYLRAELEREIQEISKLKNKIDCGIEGTAALWESVNRLKEAKLWLGQELGRIKDLNITR